MRLPFPLGICYFPCVMKRGLYKTGAIILNSFDLGESDRIISFYTERLGKLRGIAKGARRSKKRFVGNLEPGSSVALSFFHSEKSELGRVEEVVLLDAFSALRVDIEKLTEACCLLELVSEMTRDGLPQPAVYGLLRAFLGLLSRSGAPHRKGVDSGALLRFFEIKLLSLLGYLPLLDACVVCRRGWDPGEGNGRIFFSPEKGGAVCAPCAGPLSNLLPMSRGTARFLTAAAEAPEDRITCLKPGTAFMAEAGGLLDAFITYQLGKELKARRFLNKLRHAPFSCDIQRRP